jgi:hypothetical protein
MATANKLAVLQKVKQEKGVPFWSFWNDLEKTKQNVRSGKQRPSLVSHKIRGWGSLGSTSATLCGQTGEKRHWCVGN